MNMKFYMTPGSCSTGIHILLEEVGEIFEVTIVNLMAGDHQKPDYLAINPKATIPTLLTKEGLALTDFMSIAWWIAKSYPRRHLLPSELNDELKVLEAMSYAVNTIHGQGFTRIFTTEKYSNNEAEFEAIKQQGEEIVKRGFDLMNDSLEGKDYIVETFSIADAALFYVEFWAEHLGMSLPEHCSAHYQRMLTRPAVRQVLTEEGYGALFQRI